MCYLIIYSIFDFPDEHSLQNPDNGARFLSALVEKTDFRLPDESLSPEAIWKTALRQGQRAVNVGVVNTARVSLTFSIITSTWRRLYVAAERSAMMKADAVEAMLMAGRVLYETLQPDYGFGFVAMDTQPIPAPATGDYGINTLYDYNFLSPRLVAKVGETSLQQVEVYRRTTFDDGGILLELSPNPLVDKKASEAQYRAASQALSVPRFQQGC